MAAVTWWVPPALVLALALPAAEGPAKLSDAQVEMVAREALASASPEVQASALKQLRAHHFKATGAKERELALYAQGTLEDRAGQAAKAAATFHRLEQKWPKSPFLPEAQVVMAEAALDKKRYKEAESRLHSAIGADLPAESVRRAQELLLWCLAEQGRPAEGRATVKGLKPLGTAKPTEKGLVGIIEALCADKNRAEAEGALQDYHTLYPGGPRARRVELAWGKLLGGLGEAAQAGKTFQKIIQDSPAAPEADEARLALATLLTDGKLGGKEAESFPSAQDLLGSMTKTAQKDGATRQAQMIKLRLALKDRKWTQALDLAGQMRRLNPAPAESVLITELRAEALRGLTQELLDSHASGPLLSYLDGEGIRSLTPALRLALVQRLALGGLPEAARTVANLAPAAELSALRKAALDGVLSSANPQGTLALLPGKGEGAQESLLRAQAQAALQAWPATRAALAKAKPGPERVQVLLTLLTRPADKGEGATARLREVEGWLARAPEKGADREPLAILAADLRVRAGDWKGALALYPATPQTANRGWVTLMRATCQARLGQKEPAKATLKQAADEPVFKNERMALGQQLGI